MLLLSAAVTLSCEKPFFQKKAFFLPQRQKHYWRLKVISRPAVLLPQSLMSPLRRQTGQRAKKTWHGPLRVSPWRRCEGARDGMCHRERGASELNLKVYRHVDRERERESQQTFQLFMRLLWKWSLQHTHTHTHWVDEQSNVMRWCGCSSRAGWMSLLH